MPRQMWLWHETAVKECQHVPSLWHMIRCKTSLITQKQIFKLQRLPSDKPAFGCSRDGMLTELYACGTRGITVFKYLRLICIVGIEEYQN